MEARFITVDELLALLQSAEHRHCRDANGRPLLTLLDLRTEHHLDAGNKIPPTVVDIKTKCPTVFCLLDELQDPRIRGKIPKPGLVVTITETGNRDTFAIRFLSKFGYTNLKGLMFGMRGWIKKDFPVETRSPAERP